MLTLSIVPVGPTDRSLSGEFVGIHNPPLNNLGLSHAESIAEHFRGIVLEAVFSGPLKREIVTAKRIAMPHGIPVRVEEKLRDLNYGFWAGRSFESIEADEPRLSAKLRRSPGSFKFPGGIKIKKNWKRLREFTRYAQAHFGTGDVVIVADDFIGMMLASQFTRIPLSKLEPWKPTEGQITQIVGDIDGWQIISLRGSECRLDADSI